MQIGVPAETLAGETRVAVTPETVKKLVAQGHAVSVQSGAGVAASVTDDELKSMHDSGVRGVRFNFVKRLVDFTPKDELIEIAARINKLGWHCQRSSDQAVRTAVRRVLGKEQG